MSGKGMGAWRRSGCYLWRTRKPHATLGLSLRWAALAAIGICVALHAAGAWWPLGLLVLFFAGRHNAYVGETGSRYFRDRQHLFGDARYGAAAKPWADLDPRCYPLPCLFPRSKFWRKPQEKFWIWVLLPVYNTEYNTKNPRRITSTKAQQQRWARDARRIRRYAPMVLRGVLNVVIFTGLVWGGWEHWVS